MVIFGFCVLLVVFFAWNDRKRYDRDPLTDWPQTSERVEPRIDWRRH
jgi:hypothetical protein